MLEIHKLFPIGPIAHILWGNRQISETERMQMIIELDSTSGTSQREFLAANIHRWLKSPKFHAIKTGQRYYEGQNDIEERERRVIGRKGEMVKAPWLANNRLSHSFMRKLVKQKIGYLLAKPFTITSPDEEFQEILGEYFTPDFFRKFKNVGTDAIVGGIGWLQVYYDEEGTLSFKRLPSTEIIPFWLDIDHTTLDGAIRVYDVEEFSGSAINIVRYVKFFTKDMVYNYIMGKVTISPDPANPVEFNFRLASIAENVRNLESTSDPDMEVPAMWDRVPLVAVKYNSEEDSLLKYIKSLVDDYDKRTSDLSNVLQDEPDKVKVVKDYDGTNPDEFVFNLVRYRTVFLRGTGSLESVDTSINADALENHLTRLRKDIYEFGSGIDTQNKDLGDTSGRALKFIYADLDMDMNDFAAELTSTVEQLVWFIKQDLILKGRGDYSDAEISVLFNMDILINETEAVDNLVKSVGMISNKTILANHPLVKDATEEEEQIKLEQQEQLNVLRQELEVTNEASNGSEATVGIQNGVNVAEGGTAE